MAAEISIKEHLRKNKKGEWITVKGYTRRVGKKGVHSPKKSSSNKPGDEFVQVLNDKLGKTTGPIVTDKFISKEERAKILEMEAKRGYNRFADYGESGRNKNKKPKSEGLSAAERKQVLENDRKAKKNDIFSRAENAIARFVVKHGGKYKKKL